MGEFGLWVFDAYLNFLRLKHSKQTPLFIRGLNEEKASSSILHRIPG